VVDGDLFLVGGGDPVLASEWWNGNNPKWPPFNETSLESLADAIQQHGVTKITGGLVGDGSRYDDEYFAPTWAAADHVTQAGPIDALLANDSWQTPQVAAKDPALGAAAVLRSMLTDRGITVGDASTGVAPAGAATIAEIQSQPLPAILAEMLTTSDNNSAEMILKEIGFKEKGQGTRAAGLQVVMEKLAAWGVPTDGVVLVDGSGLSDANRLTCAAILGVLEHGSATDAVGAGMPVAGAAGGTLFDAFTDTPLAGKLHGKTGSLNPNCNPGQLGAKSLGGYVPQPSGGAIEFVLLQNGECIANNYKPLWDQLGAALAPYPTGPSAAELAPR
ncbi:MAG TPA: D-alanyl-D-alanine carboxypeptidase/D-alanyl-D-alanine-endopeptidase, partial [Ilumatobacteraceae bacterium]|nr:D-alanyl-D-alanine carboxypeptidase/D-alanyl-D-alanine-endopeptidase [Ilumatobacteraceae bacterium]